MKDHFPLEPAFAVTIYKAQVSFDLSTKCLYLLPVI